MTKWDYDTASKGGEEHGMVFLGLPVPKRKSLKKSLILAKCGRSSANRG
jgi:hypothetical protein